MIFSETWQLILSAGKTQTRRPVKDGEILDYLFHSLGSRHPSIPAVYNANLHVLHHVGQVCAVQPGRGLPAVLYNPRDLTQGSAVLDYRAPYRDMYRDRMGNYYAKEMYIDDGWRPLRVTITAIRQEDVRQISEADAIAEGFKDQFYFWITWTKMHDPKMYRHIEGYLNSTRDNPAGYMQKRPAEKYLAWVYEFKIAE